MSSSFSKIFRKSFKLKTILEVCEQFGCDEFFVVDVSLFPFVTQYIKLPGTKEVVKKINILEMMSP